MTLTWLAVWLTTQQLQVRPERPTEIWPISVSGWVTLVASSIALVAVIWRANNKPVLERLLMLENKFDAEVKRIEKRLDGDGIARERAERAFVQHMDEKLNGFGGRVNEDRVDIERLGMAVSDQALKLMESTGDRKQINRRVDELAGVIGHVSRELPRLEIAFNKALSDQTHVILQEIARLTATRREAKS